MNIQAHGKCSWTGVTGGSIIQLDLICYLPASGSWGALVLEGMEGQRDSTMQHSGDGNFKSMMKDLVIATEVCCTNYKFV